MRDKCIYKIVGYENLQIIKDDDLNGIDFKHIDTSDFRSNEYSIMHRGCDCFGYMDSFAEAREIVGDNVTDINEGGCYNHVIIYKLLLNEMYEWYECKWIYKYNKETNKYNVIEVDVMVKECK